MVMGYVRFLLRGERGEGGGGGEIFCCCFFFFFCFVLFFFFFGKLANWPDDLM